MTRSQRKRAGPWCPLAELHDEWGSLGRCDLWQELACVWASPPNSKGTSWQRSQTTALWAYGFA